MADMEARQDLTGRRTYLIDDDADIRDAVGLFLSSLHLDYRTFANANEFVTCLPGLPAGCVLIDIRMPGKDGITLLSEMIAAGYRWPAIIMSGHGDIPLAVRAIRLGALEFLEKPFDPAELRDSLKRGFALLDDGGGTDPTAEGRAQAQAKVASLTPREREVMLGVISGLSSKEHAIELGLSHRTVEMHRGRMMRRLGASGISDLFEIAFAAGISRTRRVH